MLRILAIGALSIVLVPIGVAAQTPQEQERILRTFQQRVEGITALAGDPQVFTLPVATVFRQVIARTLEGQPHGSHLIGAGTVLPLAHHPAVFEPFPATQLHEFPALLARTLPPLPSALEYRLIGNDLVLRAVEDDVIVAVLRDAVGGVALTRR
jgi:hypothetical protein